MIKTGPCMIRGKKAVPSFIIFALPTFIINHSQRLSNINCLKRLPSKEKVTEVIRKHMNAYVNEEQTDKQIQLAHVIHEPKLLSIFIGTSGLLMRSDNRSNDKIMWWTKHFIKLRENWSENISVCTATCVPPVVKAQPMCCSFSHVLSSRQFW